MGLAEFELARSACQFRPNLRVLVTTTVARNTPRADQRFEIRLKPYRPRDLVSVASAVLTRDTFSLETEELLGRSQDANVGAGSAHGPCRWGSRPRSRPGRPASQRAAPGGDAVPNDRAGDGHGVFDGFGRGDHHSVFPLPSDRLHRTCLGRGPGCEPAGQTERWRQLDLDFLLSGSVRRRATRSGSCCGLLICAALVRSVGAAGSIACCPTC